MKNIELRTRVGSILCSTFLCSIVIFSSAIASLGQSTTVSFPTPIRTNEITGTIRARDLGDSRLTTYFYTFQGNQGDVFINVATKNFTGDVDLFLADGLRLLTKVVVYADASGESETGRVIYLRRPERLILRVEGRSPNDDPAVFRIKFAGSFEASKDPTPDEPEMPEVRAANESGIRVNSVGTIVEIIPKTKPTPKAEIEAVAEQTTAEPVADTPAENQAPERTGKPEVIISDNTKPDTSTASTRRSSASRRNNRRRNTAPPVSTTEAETLAETASETPPPRRPSRRRASTSKSTDTEPDPLASINLVIEFKDGSRIERPMNEVMRFTFDRGVLTVVSKNGTIGRYPIADVARTTIQ